MVTNINKKRQPFGCPYLKFRNFRLRVESVVLALLAATSLSNYVELALASEPTESCEELCRCKTSLLLELSLSHLAICVKRVPNETCVVSNVVDFHSN